MIKYLKHRLDLIFAVTWFWVMVFDLINKNFNEALLELIIVICSLELYWHKKEKKTNTKSN